MRISIVVAAAENNVIGKDGQLLWHLPNDLKFFKNTTWGMPVIMGRKTYDSLNKPLPGRTNIVITRNDNWNAQGVLRADSLQNAIRLAEETDAREAYVIGGGEIYVQALPIAHRIYLTRVKAAPEGDVFFPALKVEEWKLLSQLPFDPDEKHVYSYCFEVWERS
jgi:dihydrofolate reductase